MRQQTFFAVASIAVLSCAAVWAQPPLPHGINGDSLRTFPVLLQNDDLEPLPISAADREAEQDAAVELRSLKDKQGQKRCLVISEQPDRRVTSVAIFGGPVDDDTFELVSHLCRVGTVNLERCKFQDEQLKRLSGLKTMINLVLTETPVTDKGMVHVSPLASLQSLHLSKTKISDRGLDAIAKLKDLRILNLSQTKVTDAGIKKLQPLTKLAWLLLSDTAVTDKSLQDLAAMKGLRRLTLTNTKVTAAGIDRLKQSAPRVIVDH
jgi:hypothetical protein